ncbi:unnamed protein product [Soboliphyme baturini]|uniref:Uncharacterized protein n=1 Tax=Soboliphyme baturini TaxID=241478 RepID=A0A183J2E2_9BILA|nr:unnamed protein product [Soboliphyme baturini]
MKSRKTSTQLESSHPVSIRGCLGLRHKRINEKNDGRGLTAHDGDRELVRDAAGDEPHTMRRVTPPVTAINFGAIACERGRGTNQTARSCCITEGKRPIALGFHGGAPRSTLQGLVCMDEGGPIRHPKSPPPPPSRSLLEDDALNEVKCTNAAGTNFAGNCHEVGRVTVVAPPDGEEKGRGETISEMGSTRLPSTLFVLVRRRPTGDE